MPDKLEYCPSTPVEQHGFKHSPSDSETFLPSKMALAVFNFVFLIGMGVGFSSDAYAQCSGTDAADSVCPITPKGQLPHLNPSNPPIKVGQPSACMTPWGTRIPSGSSILAYLRPETTKTERCIVETRNCTNGVLSGTYQYPICTEVDPPQKQCWNGEVLDYDMPCLEVTTESRTLSCPAGWSGTHQQERTRTYRSLPYQLNYSDWRNTVYTCVAPPPPPPPPPPAGPPCHINTYNCEIKDYVAIDYIEPGSGRHCSGAKYAETCHYPSSCVSMTNFYNTVRCN